jgi:hypothetical protein
VKAHDPLILRDPAAKVAWLEALRLYARVRLVTKSGPMQGARYLHCLLCAHA